MGHDHQRMLFVISYTNPTSTAGVSLPHSRTFPQNVPQTKNIPWQRKGPVRKTGSPGNFRRSPAKDESSQAQGLLIAVSLERKPAGRRGSGIMGFYCPGTHLGDHAPSSLIPRQFHKTFFDLQAQHEPVMMVRKGSGLVLIWPTICVAIEWIPF